MTARPKVDLDSVAEKCSTLKLDFAAEALAELVEQATRDNLQPIRFLDFVLEREIERKTERRIATSLRLSGLPTGKTIEGFDWTFQPRADRAKLEVLATCAFVRERDNVLFLGPPGVGKSHLAVALGVKAIKNGFSTQHYVLDDLMHALRADAAIPPARLKAKRYFNSALLIVDEVGFRPRFNRLSYGRTVCISFLLRIRPAKSAFLTQKASICIALVRKGAGRENICQPHCLQRRATQSLSMMRCLGGSRASTSTDNQQVS